MAWSTSSRLLFAATTSGCVVVFDVTAARPLRVFRLPDGAMPRFLKPNPGDPRLLLVTTWKGMPFLVDWGSGLTGGLASGAASASSASSSSSSAPVVGDGDGGVVIPLDENLLPPPDGRRPRELLARGTPPLHVDACWGLRGDCKTLFLASNRASLVRLRVVVGNIPQAPAPASGGEPMPAPASGVRVYRLARIFIAGGVIPYPEIHSSRHSDTVVVTTTKG